MIVKRDVDENGVSITTIFGFAIRDVLNGVGFATIAGAIWWTANLNSRVDILDRNSVSPSSLVRIENKLDAVKMKQDEILAGATIPMNSQRERLTRLETELAGLNLRCTNAHTEINNLERIVDRLAVKMELLEKQHPLKLDDMKKN